MKPMLRYLFLPVLLCLNMSAHAFPTCVNAGGEFSYWVFDSTSKRYLGISGYSSRELCEKAIATKDLRIACAPASVPQGDGSVIFNTSKGTVVGYDSAYFTSVEYCSTAISSTRGGIVCIPGLPGGVISLFDFVNGRIIGEGYSSVEYCKYASLSAAFANQDPYLCAMNPKGFTEIIDRNSGRWMGVPFLRAQECYEYLEKYRNSDI